MHFVCVWRDTILTPLILAVENENGFTGARDTLIYPVSVLQWWDLKAYCQVILFLFLSTPFDSSQYIFATYGCDFSAWQQQVASKGGIIIWYSSLSWIQLCKWCPGVRLKTVDSKNNFPSWRVSCQLFGVTHWWSEENYCSMWDRLRHKLINSFAGKNID